MKKIDNIVIKGVESTGLFSKLVSLWNQETPALFKFLANLGKILTTISVGLIGIDSYIGMFPEDVQITFRSILGGIGAGGMIITVLSNLQTVK